MIFITTELPKWLQTMKIECTNRLVYKTDIILQIIGPAVMFFLIKYQLWSSIFSVDGISTIGGYTASSMIEYQAWVMLVGFISQSYTSRNLAEDIRLGRISSYLMYPFEFWQFHAGSFLGFQMIQVCIALITTSVLYLFGFLPSFEIANFILSLVYCFFVGVLWFIVNFTIGILAFWIEETWMLRITFIVAAQFFSGSIIPLELFPDSFQGALEVLPFKYMTYVPVKVFMNNYDGSLLVAFGVLIFWSSIILFLARYVWKKGVRLYSAAGM